MSYSQCKSRSMIISGYDFPLVKLPSWLEALLAGCEVFLALSLVPLSGKKQSRMKWATFLAFIVLITVQIVLGDLGRIVNFFIVGEKNTYYIVFNVIAPILRMSISVLTVIEEFYTVRFAHIIFGGASDRQKTMMVRRKDKVAPYFMLGILLILCILGATLIDCSTARWYLSQGREGRGFLKQSRGGEEGLMALLAVCALVMVLSLDIYQEHGRIQSGKWKLGPIEARSVNLRVTAYGIGVWVIFVLWLLVTALPGYSEEVYVTAITTLSLPAIGVMTELHKIAKFGFYSDDTFTS